MQSFIHVTTCVILGLCLLVLYSGTAAAAATAGSISLQEAFGQLPLCGQGCFQTAITQTTCALTDVDCICNDEKLNSVATACITSSCTIKDALAAKNLTSLMCGLPVEADTTLIPIYSVFIGLTVLLVILRLVARVVTKAYFWWDDLCNLFGFIGAALFTALNIQSVALGQTIDTWFVPFGDVPRVFQMFFGSMLIYTTTRFFIRASIILFYLRVFPPRSDSKLGRVLQFTMVFNGIYNFSFLIAVIFQCHPVSYFWKQWSGEEGFCGDSTILIWAAAATGILFDLWLLALPFPQLLALNLHWKKKVMGGMMFFVGIAVMIISLIRLKSISQFTRGQNPTKDIAQLCLWSGIELDVGVICPCLPSFRLLLRHLLPRVVGTSGRYELDPVSNGTGVVRSGVRKSFGGGGGTGNRGKIVVQNTIDIKYGSNESTDARSCASVAGLVEARVSASDEESGREWRDDRGSGRTPSH